MNCSLARQDRSCVHLNASLLFKDRRGGVRPLQSRRPRALVEQDRVYSADDGRPRDEARAIVGSGADEHVPAATGGAEADRREADREGCWRGGQEILAGDGCGSRRVEAARAGDRQRQRGEDLSEALERKTTEMV